MSAKDREITESIRKLKSLDVVEGRVSIAASEVVTEDFIKEREQARRLLSA
jgi:transaldolase